MLTFVDTDPVIRLWSRHYRTTHEWGQYVYMKSRGVRDGNAKKARGHCGRSGSAMLCSGTAVAIACKLSVMVEGDRHGFPHRYHVWSLPRSVGEGYNGPYGDRMRIARRGSGGPKCGRPSLR